MNPVRQLLSDVNQQTKRVFTASARSGGRLLGFDLLTKPQTTAFLAPYRVTTIPGGTVRLPQVSTAFDSTKKLFTQTEADTLPTSVWHYQAQNERTSVLPCGLVQVGQRVLNTDYWSRDALKDLLKPRKRQVRTTRTLIAPFGHYFDGDVFVGYYDFLFLVAAKLCRMKAALPASVFENAVVAYPLVHTPYETEILNLLGFRPDQIVDSRTTNVRFETCVLGNHENWAYQTVGDVMSLKFEIEIHKPIERTGHNRIYVSRAGRRRVLNEDALVKMLKRYDFQVVEDRPRTVREQQMLYKNASFILGPHGASFANILWCEPGTHLMELFSPHFITDCYRYLAQVQGLTYSAWSEGQEQPLDARYIGEDMTVPIDALERYLEATLA